MPYEEDDETPKEFLRRAIFPIGLLKAQLEAAGFFEIIIDLHTDNWVALTMLSNRDDADYFKGHLADIVITDPGHAVWIIDRCLPIAVGDRLFAAIHAVNNFDACG